MSGKDHTHSNEFDAYRSSYADTVNNSISFSGLKVDFFTRAKAVRLVDILDATHGSAKDLTILDVGCGVGAALDFLDGLEGERADILEIAGSTLLAEVEDHFLGVIEQHADFVGFVGSLVADLFGYVDQFTELIFLKYDLGVVGGVLGGEDELLEADYVAGSTDFFQLATPPHFRPTEQLGLRRSAPTLRAEV